MDVFLAALVSYVVLGCVLDAAVRRMTDPPEPIHLGTAVNVMSWLPRLLWGMAKYWIQGYRRESGEE